MLDFIPTSIKYFLVALLWGVTNPFIKYGNVEKDYPSPKYELQQDLELNTNLSSEHVNVSSSSPNYTTNLLNSITKSLKGLINKFKKPRIVIPFLVNQSGSFLFYILLSSEPISIASPVINSLTFIVTTVVSYLYFDEKVSNLYLLILGAFLTLFGTYLCMQDD